MISSLFAALLLIAQVPEPGDAAEDPPAEAYAQDEYVNGQDGSVEADEVDEYAEPEPAVEEPPVQEAAPEEPEEEVPMRCRRVHYQDDYGRTRSRRSCTPR